MGAFTPGWNHFLFPLPLENFGVIRKPGHGDEVRVFAFSESPAQPEKSITVGRVVGVALLAAGVFLVVRE